VNSRLYFTFFISSILVLFSNASHATNGGCQQTPLPQISFVQFDTPNIDRSQPTPNPLKMKGKLTLPVHFDRQTRCFVANSNLRAVVILHGSAGVDSRGAFYSAALNAAGIATLEIDMWEARGVTGLSNRPQLPIFTHPDAFSALGFLRAHPHIASPCCQLSCMLRCQQRRHTASRAAASQCGHAVSQSYRCADLDTDRQ